MTRILFAIVFIITLTNCYTDKEQDGKERNMKKSLYFAYGSNLHLGQMNERCPDSEVLQIYTLNGFKLLFRSVADIEKNSESEVPGVIYKISEADEKNLDGYESVPTLYRKEYFSIDVEGKPTQVLYYKMNRSGVGRPPNKYYKVIEKGYEQNGLNIEKLLEAYNFSSLNTKEPIFYSDRWKD